MATTTKRTLEKRAARIRMKSEMLNYLPSPKEDSYGSPLEYAKYTWGYEEDRFTTDEAFRNRCEQEYSAYKEGIAAFNDLLSDIYYMLE